MSPSAVAADPEIAIASTSSVAGLVEAARSGDTAAFEAILEGRLERTFRLARAILGNDADARDATQDAWLLAWRDLHGLRDLDRFDAWLDRILVNACRTIQRRRGPVREIPIPATFEIKVASPGPEHLAERDAVERAFSRLDEGQRAILVLHHLERRTVPSIARSMGIPEGTVKSRLHAARAVLERALSEANR